MPLSSSSFILCVCDQQKFRRDCADAQAHLSLDCSPIQIVSKSLEQVTTAADDNFCDKYLGFSRKIRLDISSVALFSLLEQKQNLKMLSAANFVYLFKC